MRQKFSLKVDNDFRMLMKPSRSLLFEEQLNQRRFLWGKANQGMAMISRGANCWCFYYWTSFVQEKFADRNSDSKKDRLKRDRESRKQGVCLCPHPEEMLMPIHCWLRWVHNICVSIKKQNILWTRANWSWDFISNTMMYSQGSLSNIWNRFS